MSVKTYLTYSATLLTPNYLTSVSKVSILSSIHFLGADKENLFDNQKIPKLMIISLIS